MHAYFLSINRILGHSVVRKYPLQTSAGRPARQENVVVQLRLSRKIKVQHKLPKRQYTFRPLDQLVGCELSFYYFYHSRTEKLCDIKKPFAST
jgi:hypothetical protein